MTVYQDKSKTGVLSRKILFFSCIDVEMLRVFCGSEASRMAKAGGNNAIRKQRRQKIWRLRGRTGARMRVSAACL